MSLYIYLQLQKGKENKINNQNIAKNNKKENVQLRLTTSGKCD